MIQINCISGDKSGAGQYYTVTETGFSLEDAKRNARKAIIEKGLGTYVKTYQVSASGEAREQIINSGSEGYVTDFEVINQQGNAVKWTVTAKGKVNEKALGDSLKFKYRDLGKPKMLLIVSENIEGKTSFDNTKTESILTEYLLRNFTVMDREQTQKILKKQSNLSDIISDKAISQLAASAAEEEAGLLVVVKTVVKKGSNFDDTGELKNYPTDIIVKVVDSGNGTILASKADRLTYTHLNVVQGLDEAQRKIIKSMYPELLDMITTQWAAGGTIRLVIEGFKSYDDFLDTNILRVIGTIKGVNQVRDRGMSVGKTILIEVEAEMDGNTFYPQFRALKSEMGINFDSKEVKGNRVTIKLK
jgi:hypothetical protein